MKLQNLEMPAPVYRGLFRINMGYTFFLYYFFVFNGWAMVHAAV